MDGSTSQAETRSSATAEKQRVSCACLGWLTDRAMHRIAEVVLFFTFKRSDSRSAGRKRILTWNSHSRSFKVIHFAFSYWPTRGSISSYNITCRISEVFESVVWKICNFTYSPFWKRWKGYLGLFDPKLHWWQQIPCLIDGPGPVPPSDFLSTELDRVTAADACF